MILAGDVITFGDYRPLSRFLQYWKKPVLYVTGNHEYYTLRPMHEEDAGFKTWLADNHPNVTFLLNSDVKIDGVHFFGGTMWTDFSNANAGAMVAAKQGMNDFRMIMGTGRKLLEPADTIAFHKKFVENLLKWFAKDLSGQRVVITHHAPVVNPDTKYGNSKLTPAFNSLDMGKIIKKYKPRLWVYGHTHECDNQMVGKTQVLSNQRG